MRKQIFFTFIGILLLGACSGGSSSENSPKSNSEIAYMQIQKLQVEAYCACLEPYRKYLDSKKDVKDVKISRMGKVMNKAAQKCVQDYDKQSPDILSLYTSIDIAERRIYNNQFQKSFQAKCPEAAQLLIEIWGRVHPLPSN